MGRRASRRAVGRRSLPPRPAKGSWRARWPTARRSAPLRRAAPLRLVEREAPYLMDELKRVAMVTATCVGLLIFLTVVDRMR